MGARNDRSALAEVVWRTHLCQLGKLGSGIQSCVLLIDVIEKVLLRQRASATTRAWQPEEEGVRAEGRQAETEA